VRVVAPSLADAEHLHAALRELDSGPQTGRARTDHEHASSDPPLLDTCHVATSSSAKPPAAS
jgi:hypothetical protein